MIRDNSEGGISFFSSQGWAAGNLIEDNGGEDIGGGILCVGGNTTIHGNLLRQNHAADGGGVLVYTGNAQITENLFIDNAGSGEDVQGIPSSGGGVFCTDCNAEVVSNTFVDNAAPHWGNFGAQVEFRCVVPYCREAYYTFANNIVAGNPEGYGVSCAASGVTDVTAYCNNIWGNAAADYGAWCGDDTTGVQGNISECPLFCDPENGDFRLQECSPCAPGNHPDGCPCGLIGALDVGCECGEPSAVERSTWGAVKAMYR